MDLDKVERQLESLKHSSLKLSIANGDGRAVLGPNYKECFDQIDEPLDYIVLLGKVPTHTIYRFLLKIRIGGMLVAEVEDRDSSVVREIVDFLNIVASQHAWFYFVGGIKYLFVTRTES